MSTHTCSHYHPWWSLCLQQWSLLRFLWGLHVSMLCTSLLTPYEMIPCISQSLNHLNPHYYVQTATSAIQSPDIYQWGTTWTNLFRGSKWAWAIDHPREIHSRVQVMFKRVSITRRWKESSCQQRSVDDGWDYYFGNVWVKRLIVEMHLSAPSIWALTLVNICFLNDLKAKHTCCCIQLWFDGVLEPLLTDHAPRSLLQVEQQLPGK